MDDNPSHKPFYLCTFGMLKSNQNKLIKAVSDEIESNSTPFQKDDLKRLVETLSSTRLGVAPSDPNLQRIRYVYAKRFIEVIYEIETLLDEAAVHKAGLDEAAVHKAGQKFRWISVIDSWRSRRPFSSDLTSLLNKLQRIVVDSMSPSSRLKDTPDDPSTLSMKTRGEVETTYYHYQQPEESIVGREEEKERLIRCILNPSTNQQHPAVIAVTGPRGIGKTTLVSLVCNDSRVSSSFDSVLWASLFRDPYNLGLIFHFLQSDVQESSFCTQENYTESFKHRLSHYLRGRKFLLVLDTALYRFKHNHKELLEHLEVGSTGSTVILTTSSFSDIGRFTEVIQLEGIPEEECWSLFKRYAEFDEDAKQADPVLKDIGRSLVNRCCGSPLAVKILASSLRNSRDRHYWEQLNQSKLWGQQDKTSTAVYLSLEQVPIELMTCYVTSFIIARGNSASRDQMVYFWMAQGLLQSGEVNEDLRDVGNRYCNELLSMGLLQLDRTDYVTLVCVSSNNFFGLDLGRLRTICDIHPSVWRDDQYLPLITGKERTFLLRDFRVRVVSEPFLKDLISKMRFLRILLLDHFQFKELPETIENLKHLRYLSLVGNHKLQALPRSICKLLNLQTLDLSGCVQLKALPRNMHRLVSLRHLLLSLKLTIIPEEAHTSWKQLRHLKICNCQYLDSLKEGMQNLTALRALGIHDCPSIASLPNSINRLTNLKELSILNCQNLDLTGWEGLLQLRSLKSLRIQGLPKLLELPDGLQFVADSLQHLLISNCESFRMLPASLEHCTSLVEIIIESCPNLFALPQCTRALRNLRVLKIYRCPKLVQRYQMETGDDWQLISHIPMIYLDGEVSRNKASSTQQEQPGCLNTPIECQSHPSSGEIRPASATSPSEISPALEIEHPIQHYSPSPSEHITFSPPIEGAAEHPDPAPVEHSHEPALVPLIHHHDHATDLENRGADYNEQRLGKRVLDLEKEVEGKTLLFLFGECCEFEKEMLIQLWMALGLLTDEPMEEIGAKYFEKLVCKGYILYSDIGNSLYKVNTGKLNTELGMITHRRKYAMLTNGSQNVAVSAETLQVSVVCDEIDESIFTTLGRLYRLRVLLFLRNYGSRLQEVPRDMFLCNGSLVALDLSGAHIKELPSSVEKMIHLRFLDLSWTFLERLPERIDHFEKLQTLKLKGCYRLHRLPKELKGLTELRHLDLDVLGQLASFPEGIGTLVNLRTLSAFPVGIEEGCKISELKYLDNLTGEFCIANLENVNSANEAEEASLTAKRSIKQLELRWSDHQFQEPKNEEEAILESLCPYSDLEEIQILCYPGTSFPGWITDVSFHKLVSITMFRCVHVSVLPSFEKLPSLISLELTGLNSVENVNFKGGVDHVGFPRLQKLAVDEMLNVESWGEALEGDYPCLVNVSIKDCPKLPELPSLLYLPSIKHLEVSGCTKLAFVSDKELSNSLLQLIVEDCPLIKERCSNQEGQDWYKIEQVQTMWIDQVTIKKNEDLIDGGGGGGGGGGDGDGACGGGGGGGGGGGDDDDDDDDESYHLNALA